jgi:hypothetical protein
MRAAGCLSECPVIISGTLVRVETEVADLHRKIGQVPDIEVRE